MRTANVIALLSVGLTGALLLWVAPLKMSVTPIPTPEWLDRTDVDLFHLGLLHRHDIAVRVNGQDVARGYSQRDCDGLLLVARLPNTAQGWRHILPDLDLSDFTTHYVYEGQVYASPPVLERLRSGIAGSVPGLYRLPSPVIALAETGHCHLVQHAVNLFTSIQSPKGTD